MLTSQFCSPFLKWRLYLDLRFWIAGAYPNIFTILWLVSDHAKTQRLRWVIHSCFPLFLHDRLFSLWWNIHVFHCGHFPQHRIMNFKILLTLGRIHKLDLRVSSQLTNKIELIFLNGSDVFKYILLDSF